MRDKIVYEKLNSGDEEDIQFLKECCSIPEIEKFIKISDSFFHYVTNTLNVYYYKILLDNKIVGGLHLQVKDDILYFSIWVMPSYQRIGIAEKVVNDLKNNYFNLNYDEIQVGVAVSNKKSISLFKKLEFEEIKIEEDIIDFKYTIKN